MAEIVTVRNRTQKELEVCWDGKRTVLPVGKPIALPLPIAEAAKRQNVLMGSEDPRTGFVDYLVGIDEWGDDCSPIEQTNSIERWNSQKVPGRGKVEVVKGKGGLFADEKHAALPLGDSFVNPD
jgi:hypothetical protein